MSNKKEKRCVLGKIIAEDQEIPVIICEDSQGRLHFTLPTEEEVKILKALVELKKEAEKHVSEQK